MENDQSEFAQLSNFTVQTDEKCLASYKWLFDAKKTANESSLLVFYMQIYFYNTSNLQKKKKDQTDAVKYRFQHSL